MQRLEVSGAVRPIYGSLGVKRLTGYCASLTRRIKPGNHIGVHNRCPAQRSPVVDSRGLQWS